MDFLGGTRTLYALFVAGVGLQRLGEMRLSAGHARRLLERGGVEAGRGHLPWLVALNAVFLVACPVEVFALGRPFLPSLAAPAILLFVMGQALRYWAILTLGERWSVRLIALPGAPPVLGGPYRWLRHPNYLGVVLEFIAIPLIHAAWLTALVGNALNGAIFVVRIRAEEQLWREVGEPGELEGRPRFLPRV